MLIVEGLIVYVKCRIAMKVPFLYFNLCLSVMLDILSCSLSCLTNTIT
jgi:hypothetical protein